MIATTRGRQLLFVDDEPDVHDGIRRSLRGVDPAWKLYFAGSVSAALELLARQDIDVIVTDMTMPGRDGFDLLAEVQKSSRLSRIPVLVLTGYADRATKRRALDGGAYDLIAKPVETEDLIARLRSVLRTKDYEDSLALLNTTLEREVLVRTRELEASRTDILFCLAMAGECKDTDTGHHLIRVARYARRLAEALAMTEAEVQTIFKASPLHDIGKLGVPDHILLKPGPLTSAERETMQQHCEIGHRILTSHFAIAVGLNDHQANRPANPLLQQAAEIALCHHERWDGTGYPRGLAGEKIPFTARVVAVADVYDALTTTRPYKVALSHAESIDILRKSAGTHFDPEIIATMQKTASDFDAVRVEWSNTEQEARLRLSA